MAMSLSWITDSIAGQALFVDPGQPAVAFDDGTPLTWTELRQAELHYARSLQRAGVTHGDRVGLLLRNSLDYVVFYLAIARVGAIAVRLNFRLAAPELSFILNDAGATMLVFDADFAGPVESLRDEVPVTTYVVREDTGAGPDWAVPLGAFLSEEGSGDFPQLEPGDPVGLIYTSGTTGRPKGVVYTHGNTLACGWTQALRWKFDTHTVAMTSGPLFHVGGLEAVLLPAMVTHGTAVTFTSGGLRLERLLEVACRQEVTTMLLYSFMVYDLLRMDGVAELLPPSLTRIVCGGDTLMPWAYGEFGKALPGIELVQVYGLSEGGPIVACLDWEHAREHPGGVGRPMPLSEIKLLGSDNAPVATGEVGEIYVRSPSGGAGYWRQPDATAETFAEGWCRTGDLGQVDAHGFLTLAGRGKDMIRSGGENIYAAEVEAVITTAPGVADAAVFAVPDAKYQEVGCAVLIPIAGSEIDIDVVRKHCAGRLAKYKIPKHFVATDELPRTPSGKVKKFELRAQYASLGDQPPAD
jgi:fatty-acyl-CoA synthase